MYVTKRRFYNISYTTSTQDGNFKNDCNLILYPGLDLVVFIEGLVHYIFEDIEHLGDTIMIHYRCPELQNYGCIDLDHFVVTYIMATDKSLYLDRNASYIDITELSVISNGYRFTEGDMCLLTNLDDGFIDEPMVIASITESNNMSCTIRFRWVNYDRDDYVICTKYYENLCWIDIADPSDN